eukprot:GEMP01022885.1.p1 GENE.GEMP01022885.1~~GEMP01022885.1.p1  ORF type:complete len:414 (+),score=71.42 GEMP01022885.1:97-1338(+)
MWYCACGQKRRLKRLKLVCDNGETATVKVCIEENRERRLKDLMDQEFAESLPAVNFRNAQIYLDGRPLAYDTCAADLHGDLLVLECPDTPLVGSIPVERRLPLQIGQTYTLFLSAEMRTSDPYKKALLPEGTQVKIENVTDNDRLYVSAFKRKGYIDKRCCLGIPGIPLGFRTGEIWQTRIYCTVFSTNDFTPHRLPPNVPVVIGHRDVASVNHEPMITIRVQNGSLEAHCVTRDPVGMPTLKPGYGGVDERWNGGDWFVCADDAGLYQIPRGAEKVDDIPKSSLVMLANTHTFSAHERWHQIITLQGKSGWTSARFASVHQIFSYHVMMMYPSKGLKKVFKAHICPEMLTLRTRWEAHLRGTMGMRAVPDNITFFAEACEAAVASARIKKLARMLRLSPVIVVAVLLGKRTE